MAINQTMMDAVRNLDQAITFGASALTQVQEESIATAVSVINRSRFEPRHTEGSSISILTIRNTPTISCTTIQRRSRTLRLGELWALPRS